MEKNASDNLEDSERKEAILACVVREEYILNEGLRHERETTIGRIGQKSSR